MSDETQRPPEAPKGRIVFTEADSSVQRTVIAAFLQSYNMYHHVTRTTGLDTILADLIMRARALHEIGEVDQTYLEQFENLIHGLDEVLTRVGRTAAATLDFMVQKRGGQTQNLNEWPELLSDEEM